ncbi:uncharacterized protein LOC118433311 isoform X1 [Folsomia candida]|uniref:uncharacterized protein LOC118433311 isoform X1 n=2 Tax=Folsomia candida TaxID=158441 RepID=UPI0016050E78|nr:uncharacterized protein LOC118433311 isoform X1 [Folsomia candida]
MHIYFIKYAYLYIFILKSNTLSNYTCQDFDNVQTVEMDRVIEIQPGVHVTTNADGNLKELEKIDSFYIKKKSGSSSRLAVDAGKQEIFSYGQKVIVSGVPAGTDGHHHLATMGFYDKGGVEFIAVDLKGNIRSGDKLLGKIEWADNSCPWANMRITVSNCLDARNIIIQPQGDIACGGCCFRSGLCSSMVKYDILVGRQTVGTMEERGDDRGPKVEFPVTLSPATKGVIAVLSFMIYDSYW